MSINPMYLGAASSPAPVPPAPGTEPVAPYDPSQLGAPQAATQVGPPTPTDWRAEAERILQSMGVDLTDPVVVGRLAGIEASSTFFDQTPGFFDTTMGVLIADLRSAGIIVQTPYEQMREVSGFGGQYPVSLGETTPSEVRGAPPEILTPGNFPITESRTGWLQYPSGVLVAPGAALGSYDAVFYPPTSTAPGSATYFQQAQLWSQDKVNEWRTKLVDLGYLDEAAKKGAYDVGFQNAMRTYFTIKYQNGGRELALEGRAALEQVAPFNFHQIQGQIRNDVRTQYQRIFGDDPTPTELDEWEDFIISQAHRLYRRGQLAPGEATVEAEERFVERLEQSPEAQFVTENLEENTGLRDSLLRAVIVSESMTR